jgi:hypothetical protein
MSFLRSVFDIFPWRLDLKATDRLARWQWMTNRPEGLPAYRASVRPLCAILNWFKTWITGGFIHVMRNGMKRRLVCLCFWILLLILIDCAGNKAKPAVIWKRVQPGQESFKLYVLVDCRSAEAV